MIQLDNVSKKYGNFEVLKDINLTVDEREFILLLGPSGCGKTTLLNIIGLMDNVSKGIYKFKDKEVSQITFDEKSKIRNSKIGFVFQGFHLLPHLKVVENVALPLGYAGVSKEKRQKRAIEVLKIVGLEEKINVKPAELSGGQKQRVAIARAVVTNPLLIIADEPTGNLDTKNSDNIMNYFKHLNQLGHTVIMSTHNENLVKYASRIINMIDGKIINDKKGEEYEML